LAISPTGPKRVRNLATNPPFANFIRQWESSMVPYTVLAGCRVCTWTQDRAALRHGAFSQAKTHGGPTAAPSPCVLDFERARVYIAPRTQALLLLVYRDGFDHRRGHHRPKSLRPRL
jgi:hypothetical protein